MRTLDYKKSGKSVDIAYLKDQLVKAQSKVKPNSANQFAKYPPKVKQILDKVQEAIQKNNLSME